MSDDESIREFPAYIFMRETSLRPVGQAYVIQRELARLEVCRRGALMDSLIPT